MNGKPTAHNWKPSPLFERITSEEDSGKISLIVILGTAIVAGIILAAMAGEAFTIINAWRTNGG